MLFIYNTTVKSTATIMVYKLFSNCLGGGSKLYKSTQEYPHNCTNQWVHKGNKGKTWSSQLLKTRSCFLRFSIQVTLYSSEEYIFLFDVWTTGIEGMAVWNAIAATLLCKIWHFKSCLINSKNLTTYHAMNSMCKGKILRYGVHLIVRKIITTHCAVVMWEKEDRK